MTFKTLRRVFKRFLLGFGGFLALAVAFYLGVVYPRDSRVRSLDIGTLQPYSAKVERRGSLFIDRLPHRLELAQEDWERAKAKLMAAYPFYSVDKSRRFVSPWQVYVPLGRYPHRLEALDAIFLPNGTSLEVNNPYSDASEMRWVAIAPRSEGRLEVEGGIGVREVFKIDDGGREHENVPLSDRFGAGVINVDQGHNMSRWHDQKLTLKNPGAGKVRFFCQGARYGCLLADLGFFAPLAKPKASTLLVLVDTMRADAPAHGHARNMLSLANKSLRFSRALAPGNMTAPSVNAMLSCRTASRIADIAYAYGVDAARREAYYDHRQLSFPEILSKAGITTAMIGNVSIISEVFAAGVSHGFDRQVAIEVDPYDTPIIAREVIQWLSLRGDETFFLYVHFNGPHAPYRGPWSDVLATFPGFSALGSYPGLMRWLYQSEVRYTDRYIGQILQALTKLGLAENTNIIITADHGDQHRSRDFVGNHAGEDFSGAFFDHGATLYNDEISVPLLAHQAGQSKPKDIHDIVSTLDVGPTILDWHGLATPSQCDGRSLRGYYSDSMQSPARLIGSEGHRGRALILDGRYKYIRTYEATDKLVFSEGTLLGVRKQLLVPEALFDLTVDPDESRDMIADSPDLAAIMRQLFHEYYEIKTEYELIIDDPQTQGIEAQFSVHDAVRSLRPGLEVESHGEVSSVKTNVGGRSVVGMLSVTQMPSVKIGGKLMPIGLTNLGLPLVGTPSSLPLEVGGLDTLLPMGKEPKVILRRVENNGQVSRRILAGNPRFEAVLRQWGYLNDQ